MEKRKLSGNQKKLMDKWVKDERFIETTWKEFLSDASLGIVSIKRNPANMLFIVLLRICRSVIGNWQ